MRTPARRVRLKHLCEGGGEYGLNIAASEYVDEGVRLIRTSDLTDGRLAGEAGAIFVRPESVSPENLLRPSDLLLSRSGTIGRAFLVPPEASGMAYAGFLVRFRVACNVSPQFLYYCTQADDFQSSVRSEAVVSTIQNFNAERYGNLAIPVPPLEEQRAIVNYLDHEIARIDMLIEEQQRLIDMLNERRRSVVDRVIGGLDSDACRPTSDQWWPELPGGWALLTLRRVIRALADGPHFSPDYVDDGVMFLSARNIKVDGWSLDDAKFVSEDDYLEFSKRIVPELGDVLYTKGGTTGVARAVDLNLRFQVWVHIAVLKVRHDVVDPFFLACALNSTPCYDQSQLFTRGATNNDLGLTRMVDIVLPVPPIEEQRRIAAHLEGQTARINVLVAETERFIELARERRAALITAAVTGQIDVREMV